METYDLFAVGDNKEEKKCALINNPEKYEKCRCIHCINLPHCKFIDNPEYYAKCRCKFCIEHWKKVAFERYEKGYTKEEQDNIRRKCWLSENTRKHYSPTDLPYLDKQFEEMYSLKLHIDDKES